MTRLPVTLCVSTRNAATELPGCIESVFGWVSEIVVIDMESSDETRAVAERYGAIVIGVPTAGWAEPGRQRGIDAATQPWILFLDADERATPGLAEVVAATVNDPAVDGAWVPFQNFQFGWWVRDSGLWPDWHLRLFRRDATFWPGDRTHVGAQVTGRCIRLPEDPGNAIVHHSFPTVGAWISRMNRYTDLEADRFQTEGAQPALRRVLIMPLLRFGDLYVRRRGYRGGRYGLTVALLSFCYWLLAELKLWERELDASRVPAGSVPEEPRWRAGSG